MSMAIGSGLRALDILDLGDLTPKRRTVTVIRDGERVALEAYVYGTRSLGSVKVELASRRNDFLAASEAAAEDATARDTAYIAYLRESLRTLIPGLTFFEADALAGDDERGADILRALEYFRPHDATESAPEVADDTPLTMPSSLPTSSRSASGRRKH